MNRGGGMKMKKNDPVTSRNGSSLSKTGLIMNKSSSTNGHLEDVIVQLEKRDSDKKQISRSSSSKKLFNNTSSSSDELMNMSTDNISDSEMENEGNVFQQLAQKEKDLILAAEVGKALLERNEELTLANEKITEEYSHKLELLEQEKHGLKRRLDTLASEYDSQILELQSELNHAQKNIEELQVLMRQTEKEKAQVVQELIEQNHRLTRELKEASESEDIVSSQLQSLREQVNARRSNIHDHVAQLEGFREEITILGKRKSDLEKRLTAVTEEREKLAMAIEENCERIVLLEKRNEELESTIQIQYKELEELRHANTQIHNKLDNVIRKQQSHPRHHELLPNGGSNNPHNQPASLFNEIEMSSSSSIEEELSKTFADDDEEDIECDPAFPPTEDFLKIRHEIVDVYHVLQRQIKELQRRREAMNGNSLNSTPDSGINPDSGIPSSPDQVHSSQVRVGLLSSVVRQLESVLKDIFPEEDGPCTGCRSVALERNELEKLRKEMIERKDTIKRLSEENNELIKKFTLLDVELKSSKEENENLKETIENSNLPKDEIIKRTMKMREEATARKNQVEIELAKTRIEVMHINSQLMESVQQKVELSQQLEQWQVDMQSLIDDSLRRKLTEHEEAKQRAAGLKNATTKSGNNLATNVVNSSSSIASSIKATAAKQTTLAAGFMNKVKLWR